MKFRLLTQHYANDMLLEEGTIVGDGTPYSWTLFNRPSINMEPLDDAASVAYKERMKQYTLTPVPIEIMKPPGAIATGQRIGGLGPAAPPRAQTAADLPGQGPRDNSGNVQARPMGEVMARPVNVKP